MGFSYQLKYLIDFVLLFLYTKSYIIQESIKYISYHMRGFHTIFMYKYSSYRMTRSIKTYLLVFIDFIQLMTGHRIINRILNLEFPIERKAIQLEKSNKKWALSCFPKNRNKFFLLRDIRFKNTYLESLNFFAVDVFRFLRKWIQSCW